MGQIADVRARLAQAAAEEEQARVEFDMSKRELGELEKCWKAVEREAGQGERNIKKTRAEVEALRKKADGTGWNAEKERAHDEALRQAKDNAQCCAQVCSPSAFQVASRVLIVGAYAGAGRGAFEAPAT